MAFGVLDLLAPAASHSWNVIAAAWIVIGGVSVIIAVLPDLWIDAACKVVAERPVSSLPIKLFGGFAVFSYLLTAGLDFAPLGLRPTPQLVYTLCPACTLSVTVDPSLSTVLLLLAPLDAAVYGALGAVVGYVLLALHKCVRRSVG